MKYTIFKKLSCYAEIVRRLICVKITKKPIPLMIELQLTKRCNLQCSYCYAELEGLRESDDLTFDKVKYALNELHSMGTRVIRLLGGEPLIREDLGEIIRHIKSKGMFIELSTNGTLLGRKAGKLAELKLLDILQVSIDGNRESTDIVRGEGVYDKIIEGIVAAKKNGLPVRIHGVFNRLSLDASAESPVEHLARLSKEHRIPFNFCQYVTTPENKNMEAYVPFSATRLFHERCMALKDEGYWFFNSRDALRQIINWPIANQDILYEEDRNIIPSYFSKCRAGELYCFIDSDGGMYPCVPLWKRGLNIWESGIKEAWSYLSKVRQEANCFCCVSLGDIEFSKTMSLKKKVLLNTFRNVFNTGK